MNKNRGDDKTIKRLFGDINDLNQMNATVIRCKCNDKQYVCTLKYLIMKEFTKFKEKYYCNSGETLDTILCNRFMHFSDHHYEAKRHRVPS